MPPGMVGIVGSNASHLARLQLIVLSWDYLNILSQHLDSEIKRKRSNVDKDEKKEDEKEEENFVKVPDTFKDMDEYLSVFEPLLLEECRAQIIRGQELVGSEPELHVAVPTRCEKSNEFHFAILAAKEETVGQFHDTDLVLISKEKPIGEDALPSTYAMAIVEGREGKNGLRVRLSFGLDGDADVAGINKSQAHVTRLMRMCNFLEVSSGAPVWITHLCNLSTISREYIALRSAPSFPFSDVILSAKLADNHIDNKTKQSIPDKLLEHLKSNHNDSQMKAILAGLSRMPLVLIQGPPGTGKTQTILGLLSCILHSKPFESNTSIDGKTQAKTKSELSLSEKQENWMKASPWLLSSGNPRDDFVFDEEDKNYDFFGGYHHIQTINKEKKQENRILVCAPSNAALDEIVLRLIHTGLRDQHGNTFSPNVVRIGLNAHHSVSSVNLDNLVSQRMNSVQKSANVSGSKIESLNLEKERIRLSILNDAQIVCSTLAFSGSSAFSKIGKKFDVVVIDEAAQAVEPSVLVPLCHGCNQAILVGDPRQLPATVLSTTAVKYGYDGSMFRRLQQGGYPVIMLNIQYRMHSTIRQFPSAEFYNSELQDAPQVDVLMKRNYHSDLLFGPFFFFDLVQGKEEQPGTSGSWVNNEEVAFVVEIYKQLVTKYSELKLTSKVGVISPYKHQVKLIRQKLQEVFGKEMARHVDVNTVDGFQGREKEIIIFSCVRANKNRGIGFLSDHRRMNVALTRAKSSILLVGCAKALVQDGHWSNLVKYSKSINRYKKVERPFSTIFSEASLQSLAESNNEKNENVENVETEAMSVLPGDDDNTIDIASILEEDGHGGGKGVDGEEDMDAEEEEEEEKEEEEMFAQETNQGDFDEDDAMGEGEGEGTAEFS